MTRKNIFEILKENIINKFEETMILVNVKNKTAKILDGDGNVVTADADGLYTINGTSFTIVNDNTGMTSNNQVRFKSIKIYTVTLQ